MTLAAFIDRSNKDKEGWKYTDLEELLARTPNRAEAKEAKVFNLDSGFRRNDDEMGDGPRLYFMNGVFRASLSQFGSVPSCILMGDLESGYKLTLGQHTCLVAQPIEMVFETDENAPQEINIKFSIDIGNNGRLTLLENHLASRTITTIETDIVLHACAKFVHGKILQGGAHIAETKVRIAGGGYYNNFSLLCGGLPARNEINVMMQGEGAQVMLCGAMLLRGSDHADTTAHITHEAPSCTSRQIYKTVLDGKSRGVFQGKVTVAKDAQKSDSNQTSRALLLSDQAEMDAKPELEIFADDVKCSHGSAIGDLDENALFYLRSRGLNDVQARALLIQAFVSETLDEIHIEEWRDIFRQQIEGWAK